jgi:hypothetical protein
LQLSAVCCGGPYGLALLAKHREPQLNCQSRTGDTPPTEDGSNFTSESLITLLVKIFLYKPIQ